jgi:hypothetical protein
MVEKMIPDTTRSASGMVEKMIPQIQLGLLQAWWKI